MLFATKIVFNLLCIKVVFAATKFNFFLAPKTATNLFKYNPVYLFYFVNIYFSVKWMVKLSIEFPLYVVYFFSLNSKYCLTKWKSYLTPILQFNNISKIPPPPSFFLMVEKKILFILKFTFFRFLKTLLKYKNLLKLWQWVNFYYANMLIF